MRIERCAEAIASAVSARGVGLSWAKAEAALAEAASPPTDAAREA